MSDAVTVRPKDWVPFRCRLCGSCCRNLRGNLMPEQLDAHRLARFLRERGELEFMEDFYTNYLNGKRKGRRLYNIRLSSRSP